METLPEELDTLEDSVKATTQDVIVVGDFNGKSPEWEEKQMNRRAGLIAELMVRLNLSILNDGGQNTFRRGMSGSVIDLTMVLTPSSWRK